MAALLPQLFIMKTLKYIQYSCGFHDLIWDSISRPPLENQFLEVPSLCCNLDWYFSCTYYIDKIIPTEAPQGDEIAAMFIKHCRSEIRLTANGGFHFAGINQTALLVRITPNEQGCSYKITESTTPSGGVFQFEIKDFKLKIVLRSHVFRVVFLIRGTGRILDREKPRSFG